MTFKVEISGRLISATIEKSLEAQIAEIMEKQLLFANTEIIERTLGGKDADEQAFVPYSKSYAQFREENGRQKTPVNLKYSQRMQRAMKTKLLSKGTKGQIYFNSAAEAEKAANIMKGVKRKSDGVQNARKFFAFGKKLEDKIFENFKALIDITKANK